MGHWIWVKPKSVIRPKQKDSSDIIASFQLLSAFHLMSVHDINAMWHHAGRLYALSVKVKDAPVFINGCRLFDANCQCAVRVHSAWKRISVEL